MKKIIKYLVVFLMIFSISSCGNQEESSIQNSVIPSESILPSSSESSIVSSSSKEEVLDNVNPFISSTGKPLLCAHRGGSVNNPENTLKAYKYAVEECQTDILESDAYLTKDNQLVLLHDSTVDRTSDAKTYLGKSNLTPGSMTLDELKTLNFGYNFKSPEGETPYKNIVTSGMSVEQRKEIIAQNEVSILTLDELLGYFYQEHKELLFVIEIKNSGVAGQKAADIISQLLVKYSDYKNRLVVGTFNGEVENYLNTNYPHILTGASTSVAEKFVKKELLGMPVTATYDFSCLQIPTTYSMSGTTVNLIDSKLIDAAHKNNIAVQYWTINDEATMKSLIKTDCDAIMTDNPKLLREILNLE